MNPKLRKHFGSQPIVWVAMWGISKLRKRAGKFAGAIEGEASWYDRWYARVMSEEMAGKLAEHGVNLAILPFSLGGQADTEQEERDDFERMTKLLHARGIVSVPYLQYQNILHETFEFPETTWGVQLNGSREEFNYWRRTVCQASPAFRDYLKQVTTDAVHRGADGIWIDNTHMAPCRCDGCQMRFKDWLAANRGELLEELYLDSFERVEMPRSVAATFDPMVQALMAFASEQNHNILSELKAHLESLSPNGLFASNPGLYRGDSTTQLYGKGLDLYPIINLHDMLYLENKFFPNESGEQTTGNYHGMIACTACDCAAVPGGWKRGDFDSTEGAVGADTSGFPSNEEEVRRALFEPAAFGGVLGMMWAIRSRPEHMCASSDDLMSTYLEHPTIENATRKAMTFLKSLPVYGDSANQANIAVLYHRESLAYHGEQSWAAVHAVEEMLLHAGLAHDVLFSETFAELARSYALIVLPEVTVMSDGDAELIARYVHDGGRVLVLGNGGIYTERMRTRPEFALYPVTGVSRFDRDSELVTHQYGAGQSACLAMRGSLSTPINNMMRKEPELRLPRWYSSRDALVTAIDRLLGDDRQIRLITPLQTAVTVRSTDDGRTAIHLLSYRMHEPETEVQLKLRADLAGCGTGQWHTPDDDTVTVHGESGGRPDITFTLPGFRDYGVLILNEAT